MGTEQGERNGVMGSRSHGREILPSSRVNAYVCNQVDIIHLFTIILLHPAQALVSTTRYFVVKR